jgi:hypothetical protein
MRSAGSYLIRASLGTAHLGGGGFFGATTLRAQQKERTLDEIKTEAVKRAETGMYPLIGLDPADVRAGTPKDLGPVVAGDVVKIFVEGVGALRKPCGRRLTRTTFGRRQDSVSNRVVYPSERHTLAPTLE